MLDPEYLDSMDDESTGQYVTDALGRVEGVYWGSNVVDQSSSGHGFTPHEVDITIPAMGVSPLARVNQGWASDTDATRWSEPSAFVPGKLSTIVFRPRLLDNQTGQLVPICGHDLRFLVTQVNVMHPDARAKWGGRIVVYTLVSGWGVNPSFATGTEVHVVSTLDTFAEMVPASASEQSAGVYSTSILLHGGLVTGDRVDHVYYDVLDSSVSAK